MLLVLLCVLLQLLLLVVLVLQQQVHLLLLLHMIKCLALRPCHRNLRGTRPTRPHCRVHRACSDSCCTGLAKYTSKEPVCIICLRAADVGDLQPIPRISAKVA